MSKNPYHWTTDNPEILIELPVFGAVHDALLEAERLVLVGGHGMGKSVLLRWLSEAFDPKQVKVELIKDKPPDYSVPSCVRQLGRRLDLTGEFEDITELFGTWFKRDERNLVLLYDEIDRYVDDGDTAKNFLSALAKAHESHATRLGIAVAGGLGVYKVEAELGSPFTSRATWKHLAPLTREQIVELAQPFAKDDHALSAATLDAIELFSGGNPALVTYALQTLWDVRSPIDANVIGDVPRRFKKLHRGFKRAVYRGLEIDDRYEAAANGVWRYIQDHPGPQLTSTLRDQAHGTQLKLERILELLEASGLIRLNSELDGSHVDAEIIPSFLRPLDAPTSHATQADQFHRDMESALRRLSRYRLDLYQDQKHTTLSREAVLTAFLAMQFELSGWDVVMREGQQGPGYVDISMRHPAFRNQPSAVVEVKLWTNPKRAEAHEQVLSYYDHGTPEEQCMAVVMIAAPKRASDEEWRREYGPECLPDSRFEVEDLPVAKPLLDGYRARLHGDAGRGVWVSHYLLSLRRRDS